MKNWLFYALMLFGIVACSSDDDDFDSTSSTEDTTTAPVENQPTTPDDTDDSDQVVVEEPVEPETPVVPEDPGSDLSDNQPVQSSRANFAGFSDADGELTEYTAPTTRDGGGKTLMAIYLVGSDLEGNSEAGTVDLNELIAGYNALSSTEQAAIDVVVAFGGTNKNGWKGMRIADMSQILSDGQDGAYGNDSNYLYVAPNAHMGDDTSLQLFAQYLKDGYADHERKFLTMWDHGAAYGSFGNDMNYDGDGLTMQETDSALSNVGMKYDIIGYDACLNANFELASVVKKHADYLIASEELEPGHGWNYTGVIQALARNENLESFGKAMIDDFVKHSSHPYNSDGKTLSMAKLSEYDALLAAVDGLASYITQNLGDQQVKNTMISAASKAQQYGKQSREEKAISLDLNGFARTINETLSGTEAAAPSQAVLDAIANYVVYAKQDGTRPNSDGVSIVPPSGYESFNESVAPSSAWLALTQGITTIKQEDTVAPAAENNTESNAATTSDFQDSGAESTVDAFYAKLTAEINTLLQGEWADYDQADQEELAEEYWYEQEDAFWNTRNTPQMRSACGNSAWRAGCQGSTPTFDLARSEFFGEGEEEEMALKLSGLQPSANTLPMLGTMNGYTSRKNRSGSTATGLQKTGELSVAGTKATFSDDNLQSVRTVYGNIITEEDGSQFLASTALLQAFSTNNDKEYFTPTWNQFWYIMYYGDGEFDNVWLPLEYDAEYRNDGIWYTIYSAEIDFIDANKDYSAYPEDEKFDYAKLYLTVDVNNAVVSSSVRPYKIVFSSDEDMVGSILYDKDYKTLKAGDQISTLAKNYNLATKEADWYYESDLLTINRAPNFQLELLEFEDEEGQLLDYYYMMIGTDIGGNWTMTEPVKADQAGSGDFLNTTTTQ